MIRVVLRGIRAAASSTGNERNDQQNVPTVGVGRGEVFRRVAQTNGGGCHGRNPAKLRPATNPGIL